MRISRAITATAAAGILTAGFGITGAAPASAAIPLTCATLGTQTGTSLINVSSFVFVPGDTLTAVNTGAYASPPEAGTPKLKMQFDGPTQQTVAPGAVSYTFTRSGETPVYVTIASWGSGNPGDTTLTCAHSDPAPAIPDWVQAYGRASADADCPAGYNPTWAGGPSADVVSYQKSWQQWMNDGQGGWVCTRNVPSLG